jgi:allantoicase
VLIRLGTPGQIKSVIVDTSFFTGNFPEQCAVEACGSEGYPSPAELSDPVTEWIEVVPRSALRGDARNTFEVSEPRRFTHVRLSAFPDGGIARLRVLGQPVPDPRGLEQLTVDLASQQYGGLVVASSDDFYTAAQTLNRPDRARTMGEGWETRRRRDGGHDFVIFQLGFTGRVRRLIVDTSHFRYNASASIAAYGSDENPAPPNESRLWREMVGRTRLQPDTRHIFEVHGEHPVAAARVDAFPDGGLSRVCIVGSIDPLARRRAGYRWFNSLPAGQALLCLINAGVPREIASDLVGQRPLPEGWLAELRERPIRAPGRLAPHVRALTGMLEGEGAADPRD